MTDSINFDASLLKGAITKRSERKKATDEQIIIAFNTAKADGKLNKQEIAKLKEMGLTEAQIQELQKSKDGMQTLNDLAYSHVGTNFGVKTGDNAAAEIRQQRQAEVTEFVLADEVESYEDFEARLAQFDGLEFVDDDLKAQLKDTYQKEKLGRVKTTFTPDVKANPEAKAVQIRVQAQKAEGSDTIEKLDLYETTGDAADVNPDEVKPSRTLIADGKYFIEGEGEDVKYYSYNAEAGTLTDVTTNVKDEKAAAKLSADVAALAEFAPQEGDPNYENYTKMTDAEKLTYLQGEQTRIEEEKQEQKRLQTEINTRKTAFQNARQNGITINETGSTQRYTRSNVWNTGVVIPKKATYNENGYPSQIAIELPGDYGSTNADGVKQKRYSNLYYNAETNTYADKRGLRQFAVEISPDGKITLMQKDAANASARVRATLDQDIRIAAERSRQQALNDEGTKFKKEMSDDDVAQLKAGLSNRNTAWQTYLQAGTENGYLTGTYGLFEELFDEDHVKNYNDIKPMLDGLMARVPEDVRGTAEYEAVQTIINDLAADPDANVGTDMFFHFQGGKIRDLDKALNTLAKTHLAGRVQGTNAANNSFLVGGAGAQKVTIEPDKQSSAWMTDAKFNIGGTDYYLYQSQNWLWDRTVDFQDATRSAVDQNGNPIEDLAAREALFGNDLTGNGRRGEIKSNPDQFSKGEFYFETGRNGQKHKCVVDENGVVYVCSPNGQVKVPLDDVMNGRKPMPQDAS